VVLLGGLLEAGRGARLIYLAERGRNQPWTN
jgi:hypothetical protein